MSALPQIQLDAVHRVYDDGSHNAFTDLIHWRGRYWLTFRGCPDGHMVYPTSRIRVLVSADGLTDWHEAFSFNAEGRDVRDPHFLAFGEKLFVYSGAWLCDPARPGHRDINDHLGYGAWTDDGDTWRGPRSLEGTYGHYVWRAAAHRDRAFLCARRRRDFIPGPGPEEAREVIEGAMLESDDGLVWRTAGLFTEDYGNETAFLFEDDGQVVALARGADPVPARICRSLPPYVAWQRTELDRNVGGPLLAKWGERYLVAGRKTLEPGRPVTTVYWLESDALVEQLELPSGGDNSYPGFVPLDEHRGLLSYYSSHAGSGEGKAPCHIYIAELALT